MQVELSFRQGDFITVYGEMDEDGFYMGELNGVRGLVPSNFLQAGPSSSLLPPTMPPGSLSAHAQQQLGSLMGTTEQMRTKGVVFSEAANKKPLPVRQSSQQSNKMASIVATMGGATSGPAPMANSINVLKTAKSAGAPSATTGGSGRPLAKKGSDISAKGTPNAPRKTSQAAKKTEGTKVIPKKY